MINCKNNQGIAHNNNLTNMRKNHLLLIVLLTFFNQLSSQTVGINNLYMLDNAESRSISPENITGEKAGGSRTELKDGYAKHEARKLGKGWKVNPYVYVEPGEEKVLGEFEGMGVINHIWMTINENNKLKILKIYWDDEKEPSVEVPLCDFFCNGWNLKQGLRINSLPISINPKNGYNSFWQMPFRKKFKIAIKNIDKHRGRIYYQIDFTLQKVPKNVGYFHASFRRVKKMKYKEVYSIIDGIKGKGRYVGTYLAHGTHSKRWWGEGEIKFYIDGDTEYPTINGTGEEDYFLGSYAYKNFNNDGSYNYVNYDSNYAGFYALNSAYSHLGRFGQYRWHISDPIRFKSDLNVTIQCLGWDNEGAFLPLEDDLFSVAYWYQTEPHQKFKKLPPKEDLLIK